MATSRKIALLFAAENINAIFGWIALLFVARKMGASALGEFSYALSLVGSFTFIAFFGFGMAHIKRISEGSNLGKCIGTFLSIRIFLTALMLSIFIVSYWYWTSVLDKEIYDIQTPDLLLTVVLYYVFFHKDTKVGKDLTPIGKILDGVDELLNASSGDEVSIYCDAG